MVDRIADPAAPLSEEPARRRGTVTVGIQSGLLAGLLMIMVLAPWAGITGLGWLHPLEAIGATLARTGSSEAVTVAIGAILHAATSAGLGVGFATILPDEFPMSSAVIVGGGYGIFAAGVMMSFVVPEVSPAFREAVQPVGGSWTVGHVVFGGALGLFLTLLRRASRSAGRHAAAVGAGSGHAGP